MADRTRTRSPGAKEAPPQPARKRAAAAAAPKAAADPAAPAETLLDEIPEGICLLDDGLLVRHANPAFCQVLGLPSGRVRRGTAIAAVLRPLEGRDADGESEITARLRALGAAETRASLLVLPGERAVELKGRRLRGGGFVVTGTDVTERRRAEARAQISHRRLLDAFETFGEGFALFDAEDRLVLCNDRYRELYAGIADHLRAGVTFEALIRAMASSGESQVPPERLNRHVAERMAYHLDPHGAIDVRRRNGRWIRMIDRRTADGWTVAIRVDITDIKRREAILSVVNDTAARILSSEGWRAQVEEMLARLGPAAGVSRVTLSRNGVAADGAYLQEDLFEWDAPGIRRVMDDVVADNPALKDGAFQEWRARRARGEAVYGRTRDLSEGQRAWYEIQGVKAAARVPIMVAGAWWGTVGFDHCVEEHEWQPLEIDALRAAAGLIGLAINRDAIEAGRRQMEAALRDSEQRFRQIADAHPVAVVITRLSDGVIVYASRGMAAITGVADCTGMRAASFYADKAERARFMAALEADGFVEDFETRTRRVDGREFPAAATARKIVWDGVPAVITGVVDLTERKRAEAEIARQREALAHSEKLTALGSLLAGVAHELNNPLSVVVGQAALLQDTADPHIAARADRIRRAADRCARIVKTFLAMARRRPPELQPVDINAVVESASDLVAYAMRTADIALDMDLMPELPRFVADADQLGQVVANLLLNAQQALMEQPTPRRVRVVTALDRAANAVVLTVADNGPGVPPDIRARIFEPFFTTKPTGVGTGLGLSMCHGVIESHGGSIGVDETAGGGATFIVRFPLRATAAAAVAGAAAPGAVAEEPRPARATGRILVVDDEPELVEMLTEMLQVAGHEVDSAGDGRQALERIAACSYDLVLSDLRMPGLDGPGLYRAVVERHPGLADRLVFMTGDSLAHHNHAFLAETRAECVEKPLTPKTIHEVVARRLARA